jgi:hypothetical protein
VRSRTEHRVCRRHFVAQLLWEASNETRRQSVPLRPFFETMLLLLSLRRPIFPISTISQVERPTDVRARCEPVRLAQSYRQFRYGPEGQRRSNKARPWTVSPGTLPPSLCYHIAVRCSQASTPTHQHEHQNATCLISDGRVRVSGQ